MHTLFVLAHQDDEIAVATRITYALQRGNEVTVIFLTDGEGRKATSQERDAESREVLQRLGVKNAIFLGSEERIPDGALYEHMPLALQLLERVGPVDEVVCLAWEGGIRTTTHRISSRPHSRGSATSPHEKCRSIRAIDYPVRSSRRWRRWAQDGRAGRSPRARDCASSRSAGFIHPRGRPGLDCCRRQSSSGGRKKGMVARRRSPALQTEAARRAALLREKVRRDVGGVLTPRRRVSYSIVKACLRVWRSP